MSNSHAPGAPSPAPIWLDEVDSTNRWVRDRFFDLPDGVLVAARNQTAGRGRLGRRWVAPPGVNLTVTARVERVADGFHAGMILGLAALDMVRAAAPEVDPFLKWPNDLYLGLGKLGGLLCEGVPSGGRIAGVAAGIGINVNMTAEELASLDRPGASLRAATGRIFPLEKLLDELAKCFTRWYIIYHGNRGEVTAAWRRENRLLGRPVAVTDPKGKCWRGVFSDIAPDGALVMRLPDGETRRFDCGDVSLSRESLCGIVPDGSEIFNQSQGGAIK